MQYNYFEQRDKIRADFRYKLPADINQPVKEEFAKYPEVIAWIERQESQIQCRGLRFLPDESKPHIVIKLQSDYGMIEGYDKLTVIGIKMCDYLHVKNKNLSKRKPK